MAPYFPLIQSSGMGKMKLLYELWKKLLQEEKDNVSVILLLCEKEGTRTLLPDILTDRFEVPDGGQEQD